MPPMTVLIKPASSDCNLRCSYCFYRDEAERREHFSFGRMSEQTLENIVKKVMQYAEGSCTIGFQGGEPTLAGLEFYKHYIALVQKYSRRDLQVFHSIQTNGVLLIEEWAKFFHDNHFLVGLSLDGPACCNDQVRRTPAGRGSFDMVWKAKEILEKYQVDFNILTVVTKKSAEHVEEIYRFFTDNNLWYQQYIPCMAPLDAEGSGEYALSGAAYGRFLKRLFDLWYEDQLRGNAVYIRYFDNLSGMLMGYPPENCGLCGRCVNQFVVEANGNVYPCDFYVLDQYCLGNFNQNSIDQMNAREQEIGFVSASLQQETECLQCQFYPLCRGGCRRDRQRSDMTSLGKSCHCEAYRMFFPYMIPRMLELIQRMCM